MFNADHARREASGPPTGYDAPIAHLRDQAYRLLLLLQRYVARHGHRLLRQDARLDDLFVSAIEAERLLNPDDSPEPAAAMQGWPREQAIAATLEAHERRVDQRAAMATCELPLLALKLHFRLDDHQALLLLAAMGPQLSVDLGRLYTWAWADFNQRMPTVGFLAELAAEVPDWLDPMCREFEDDGWLVRSGLVTLEPHPRWGIPTPLIHKQVRVPDYVVAFLLGRHTAGPDWFDRCVETSLASDAPDLDTLIVAPDAADEVLRLLRKIQRHPSRRPRLLLHGPRYSGRRSFLAACTAQLEKPLTVVDLARLADQPEQFSAALRRLCNQAVMQDHTLLFRGEDFLEEDANLPRLRQLAQIVNLSPAMIAFTLHRPSSRLHDLVDDLYDLTLGEPSASQQAIAWKRALDASGCEVGPGVIERMNARYNLPVGAILRAVSDAVRHARHGLANRKDRPTLDDAGLHRAVSRKINHTLNTLAELYETTLTWDDVVLPDTTLHVLKEIELTARHRHRVLEDWGFERKLAYGRGLTCLFSGPPGTGKTMMAGILAGSLGRLVYRVDLSRIVSKWIGETEKNLARVFDEAERAQVVLLFDEADSLFSARTKVESSNDRYANMVVNYLLQRMEGFDGVTILTTNFLTGLDEALGRRIRFRVHFGLPDFNARLALWEGMIPEQADVADDIEWDALAEHFEFSGGLIKNAVVRAAHWAAAEGSSIAHRHLFDAAVAEAREMGMVVTDRVADRTRHDDDDDLDDDD